MKKKGIMTWKDRVSFQRKRRYRSALAVLLVYTVMLSMTRTSAHEYTPKEFRAEIGSGGSSSAYTVLYYNLDCTSDIMRKAVAKMCIGFWTEATSKVRAVEVPYIDSTVKFSDTWPATFEDFWYGACQNVKDSATIYHYPNGGTPPTSETVKKVVRSKIYFNVAKHDTMEAVFGPLGEFSMKDRWKTYTHEIGHALGLDETDLPNPRATPTIMRQGRPDDYSNWWSNYWKPQAHDINDIQRYSFKSWTR